MIIHHIGFYGVTTAEKKKMNKAGNINHLHTNSDDASKVRSRYLHGSHGLESPDSDALRYVIYNFFCRNK